MNEDQLVSAVGEEGIARLTAAFYRQVYEDEILTSTFLINSD